MVRRLEANGVWIPFSTSSGGVLWRGVGSQVFWFLCRQSSVPIALPVSVSQEQAAICVTSCQLCDKAGCSSAAVSTLCHRVAAGAAPGTDTEPWAPGSIPWHSIPWLHEGDVVLGNVPSPITATAHLPASQHHQQPVWLCCSPPIRVSAGEVSLQHTTLLTKREVGMKYN